MNLMDRWQMAGWTCLSSSDDNLNQGYVTYQSPGRERWVHGHNGRAHGAVMSRNPNDFDVIECGPRPFTTVFYCIQGEITHSNGSFKATESLTVKPGEVVRLNLAVFRTELMEETLPF
jgi:hypothetical protein